MSTIGRRILANFQQRVAKQAAETRCGRVDLQMTDFEPMSPTEATIMLQYNRGVGTPKRSQVTEWVTAMSNGRLRADSESILHYPDLTVVTAAVRIATLQMPMSKNFTNRMMRVGSTQYMDADNSIWEVREGDSGKYLLRVCEDNVEDILTERLERMSKFGNTHHLPKIRHLVTAGISDPAVGDHVEFFDPKDGSKKFGKVTSVTKDKVTVSVKGASISTARGNLVAVTKESPQSVKERKEKEVDFYAEYYFSGDRGLAKKLVK